MWRRAAFVVVVACLAVTVCAEEETAPAAVKDAPQNPMLQRLFEESSQLLRMRAKLSQDYMSDPGILKIYRSAKRQNAIALQRAKLLAQHSVAGPLKKMFGFVDAYLPEIEEKDDDKPKKKKAKKDDDDDDDKDKEKDDDKDKEKDDDKEKEEEEEEEKEKEKEEEEEKEKEEKEKKDGKKKVSKKTLSQMTDLLAELMLKREKHPTGTKQRDELNMEIDELLAHIDKAKGGDGHDRHELEKEDDHVKALEKEHANDLIIEKEYEAGLPIDDPNGYVNHHLDKLLQHVQTLRRSADGLGGMTLQELSDLEVETRALLLDLEEYKGEKVDTELLKIELDPTLGPARRQELMEADRRRRGRRLREERERQLEDKEIETQAASNQLKEIMAKIDEDTQKIEDLHHQHERILSALARPVSPRDKIALEHEAELIEKELETAKLNLKHDEDEMTEVAAHPTRSRWSRLNARLSPRSKISKIVVEHRVVDDKGRSVNVDESTLGLSHLHRLDSNRAILSSNDCSAPNICDKTGSVEAVVTQVREGEPVDGGVQAMTYQDSCGACHTVLVSCQQQCQTDSCAPDFCQQKVTTCQQDKCGNLVARTMYPVRSDAVAPMTVAATSCADTSSC